MAQGDSPITPNWTRTSDFGVENAAVAAGVGTTVVKAGPGANGTGMLCRVVITTAGTTGNCTIYDNASAGSGTILAVIPGTTANASAVVGYVFDIRMPALNGITAVGASNSPGFTVSYL
jgi:hypothetical protein